MKHTHKKAKENLNTNTIEDNKRQRNAPTNIPVSGWN